MTFPYSDEVEFMYQGKFLRPQAAPNPSSGWTPEDAEQILADVWDVLTGGQGHPPLERGQPDDHKRPSGIYRDRGVVTTKKKWSSLKKKSPREG